MESLGYAALFRVFYKCSVCGGNGLSVDVHADSWSDAYREAIEWHDMQLCAKDKTRKLISLSAMILEQYIDFDKVVLLDEDI